MISSSGLGTSWHLIGFMHINGFNTLTSLDELSIVCVVLLHLFLSIRWFQHRRIKKNWRVILCSYIFVLFGVALVCAGIVLEAVQVVEVIRGLVLVVMGIVVIIPSCESKGEELQEGRS